MRVGFIGLGMMGRNAALNVARKGFEMVVYDIRPEAMLPLIDKGATPAGNPADVLGRADVVVTMVFGPKEIEAVLRGPDGFLSIDCTGKIWIDLTTSRPPLMRDIGAEFRARGGAVIDAPVTGSVDSAIRGDMLMFVGGGFASWASTTAYEHAGWHGTTMLTMGMSGALVALSALAFWLHKRSAGTRDGAA